MGCILLRGARFWPFLGSCFAQWKRDWTVWMLISILLRLCKAGPLLVEWKYLVGGAPWVWVELLGVYVNFLGVRQMEPHQSTVRWMAIAKMGDNISPRHPTKIRRTMSRCRTKGSVQQTFGFISSNITHSPTVMGMNAAFSSAKILQVFCTEQILFL